MMMFLSDIFGAMDARDSVVAALIGVSLKAAPLVVAILLIQRAARRWMRPAWRCLLWGLVLLRLALPGLPESRASVYGIFSPRPQASAGVAAVAPSPSPGRTTVSPAGTPAAREAATVSTPARGEMEAEARERRASVVASFIQNGWRAGFLLMLGWTAWAALRFKWRMRASRRIDDEKLLALLEDCRRRMKVRRRVGLLEVPGLGSPALLGVLRPRVLLPAGFADEVEPDGLRAVLLHELAHLKRRDVAVNGIMAFLQLIHWFNPLVWLAFARMRADRELACDARVLACLSREESIAYGRTLLDLLERRAHGGQFAGAPVGILERTAGLKERLALIARGPARPAPWRATLASLAMLALLGCLSLTNPAPRPLPADLKVKVPTRPEPPLPAVPQGKQRAELNDVRVLVQVLLYSRNGGPQDLATVPIDWPAEKNREVKVRLMSKAEVGITLTNVEASTAPPGLGVRVSRTPYLRIAGHYTFKMSSFGGGASGFSNISFVDRQDTSGGGVSLDRYSLVFVATPIAKDDPLGEQPLGQFIREHWKGCFEQQLSAWVRNEKQLAPWNQLAGQALTMPNRNLFAADWKRKFDELGWTQTGRVVFSREMLLDLDTGKSIEPPKDGSWPAEFDARWDPLLKEWWIRPDVNVHALAVLNAGGDVLSELAQANALRRRLDSEGRPDEAGRVVRSPLKSPVLIRTDQGRIFCLSMGGYGSRGSVLGQVNEYSFIWYRPVGDSR